MFRISSRTNNFYVYAFYCNPGHDSSLYGCLLDNMDRVQSVDDTAVFVVVGAANAHLSERLESVSHTVRHGRDALDFCNMSGCEQLVCCHNHITGNRLDLVMTDANDTVDVFVGTPLGTSDYCFSSCVLRVEQSVPEYNVSSTAFLKHRTNWDNVRCAGMSFTWTVSSLTVSSIVSISTHLCLVSISLGTIVWPSGLMSFYECFLIFTHMVVLILWVCFAYF